MPTTLRREGPEAVLVVEGKLRFGSELDAFRACWSEALSGGARRIIIIDLAAVPAVDSSGIGCLVRCHCSANAVGASVQIARPSAAVAQILKVVRLDRILTVTT